MANIKSTITMTDKASNTLIQIDGKLEKMNKRMNDIKGATGELGGTSSSVFSHLSTQIIAFNQGLELTKKALQAIKGLMNFSDILTMNRARLDIVNDGFQTTDELQKMIYDSANRSRAGYTEAAAAVAKMSLLAGDSFKSNKETVGFVETLNKAFTVSGASQEEKSSAMYQLTQAMASGRLQGDELRTVREAAPMLYTAIAEYTGKSKGELKEMGAAGQITADVIKNAMFSAADDINNKFDKMPVTFAQAATQIKNAWQYAMQNVSDRLNKALNSEGGRKALTTLVNLMGVLANTINRVVDLVTALAQAIAPYKWIIFGIIGAFVGFNLALTVTNISLGISAAMHKIHSAALLLAKGETIAATAAQYGLNTALLLCPVTWIIVALVALIAVLIYFYITNDKVARFILKAWDALRIGAMVLFLGLKAVWGSLLIAIQIMGLGLMGVAYVVLAAWYYFTTGLKTVGIGILYIFQYIYNGVIWIVNAIIDALNSIPGVSIDQAETADFASRAWESMIEDVTKQNDELQGMVDDMDAFSEKIKANKANYDSDLTSYANLIDDKAGTFKTTFEERVAGRNDWVSELTGSIKDAAGGVMDEVLGANKDLGNIGKVGSIEDAVDISDEDLKMLRDIATKEYMINYKQITPNVNIKFGDVKETADIAKIKTALEKMMSDELAELYVVEEA